MCIHMMIMSQRWYRQNEIILQIEKDETKTVGSCKFEFQAWRIYAGKVFSQKTSQPTNQSNKYNRINWMRKNLKR